jgi:hypothetical protein
MFCDGHVESPTLGFLFINTTDAAVVRWNRDHVPHGTSYNNQGSAHSAGKRI